MKIIEKQCFFISRYPRPLVASGCIVELLGCVLYYVISYFYFYNLLHQLHNAFRSVEIRPEAAEIEKFEKSMIFDVFFNDFH